MSTTLYGKEETDKAILQFAEEQEQLKADGEKFAIDKSCNNCEKIYMPDGCSLSLCKIYQAMREVYKDIRENEPYCSLYERKE